MRLMRLMTLAPGHFHAALVGNADRDAFGDVVMTFDDVLDLLDRDVLAADLEHQLDEVEGQLEEVTNDKNELQKFYFWVREVYPEIVKDYGCVKIIEEKANECLTSETAYCIK